MDAEPADALRLEGRKLISWSVLPGGTQIRFEFITNNGTKHRIVPPFNALTGLMMILPRMLQSALDQRFRDGSLRAVRRLGRWKLERQEVDDGLIMQLRTKDGFEVAFALDHDHAGSLGAALLTALGETDPPMARRPK